MKKKLIMMFAILLLVSGCSDATTQVEKDDMALITVGEEKITKGDLYSILAANGNTSPIETRMNEILVDKYVKVTDDLKKKAQEAYDTTKKGYETDEEWVKALTDAGFKDEADYLDKLLLSARVEKLTDLFIEKEFNKLTDQYKLRKVEIVAITDATKTADALNAAKGGTALNEVAKTYGDITTYDGTPKVYNSKSGLPEIVWNNILDVNKDGKLVDKVLQDTTTSTYYIVKVTNVKPKDFKDEAIASIKEIKTDSDSSSATGATNTSGELSIADQAFAYYLKKANYSIHDVNIYQLLLTSSQKFDRE